jgi:Tfp pilus assembly protein PilN
VGGGGGGGGGSSFLPEDYVARKAETRANILVLSLFAVVLAGVLGAFVVTQKSLHEINARKERVNTEIELAGKKIEQVKALEQQRAQMMEKAEITAALVERVPRWAVMGEITLRTPPEMRLEQLWIKSTRIEPPKVPTTAPAPAVKSLTAKITGTPTKEPERPKPMAPRFTYAVTIEGAAVKNNDVADFISGLKESPILDKVEMAYIRDSKEKDVVLRKFQITASLKGDVDPNVLAGSLRKVMTDRLAALAGYEAQKKADAAKGTNAVAVEKESK